MNKKQATDTIVQHLRDHIVCGIDVRDISVVRKAAGRTWRGHVVAKTRWGETSVGFVALRDDGRIIEDITLEDLADALVRVHPSAHLPGAIGTAPFLEAASFAEQLVQQGDSPPDLAVELEDQELVSLPPESGDLRELVRKLKASDQKADLEQARDLLPQLLLDGESRRYTLVDLADVEIRLGAPEVAIQHLEAAAREFMDRSEIRALELVASIALRAIGEERFAGHSIQQLLEHTRRRTSPIEQLGQATVFAGLPAAQLDRIHSLAQPVTVGKSEVLLREGDDAVRAFVVKSGVLSIRLQAPDGAMRLIRCCFPGDLVGETSALGGAGATCTATVRAEGVASLWRFDGTALRALCTEIPILQTRLEAARALHRLDSFFSMHETAQTLGAQMRDRILACVTQIRRAEENELLNTPGAVPPVVYLIAEGSVEYAAEEGPTRVLHADAFLGLRDALHGIATDGTFVAAEDSVLVCFDPDRLREFAAEAPPDVVAVLERLD